VQPAAAEALARKENRQSAHADPRNWTKDIPAQANTLYRQTVLRLTWVFFDIQSQ
jgi:hypothetical protein